MKVNERPNANQEAQRAENKKVKPKDSNKAAMQQHATTKGFQQDSKLENKNNFDDMLNQFAAPAFGEEGDSAFNSQLKEVIRDDRESDSDDGSDLEEKKEKDDVKENKEETKIGGNNKSSKFKIKGKKSLGERSFGQRDQGKEPKQLKDKTSPTSKEAKLDYHKLQNENSQSKSSSPTQSPASIKVHVDPTQMAIAQEAKKIPQQLIDQIVAYATLKSGKEIEKEMEIALHDSVFSGLKIKVSKKNGKIDVIFSSKNSGVRSLFNSQRLEIEDMLLAKGVDVGQILVKQS